MKLSIRHDALRLATRLALTAVLVGSGALAAGVAGAPVAGATSSAPPWETTGVNYGSVGGLELFNSSGDPITGGNVSDQPIAAYVEGSNAIRSGDTKATLYGYLPVNGVAPGNWNGEAMSASTTFPNASAPSPLNTSTLPVVTGGSTDESVATLESDFPNHDSSDDGYAGMYQLRLKTSAPGHPGNTTYDSADILVSGSTWSLVYPTTLTTSTLTTTPATPVTPGTSVQVTDTVSPSDATGTVQFLNGSTDIGTPVTVSGGTASTTTSSLPAGTDNLYAIFTPDATSGGNGYSASDGYTPFVVQTATTTTLTTTPATSANFGASVQLTATVSPSGATGT
ncbi:MAG: Ig-like domain-containing protein, partial [Acidimicrobiales bacterium]